jgi:hypothetical protein
VRINKWAREREKEKRRGFFNLVNDGKGALNKENVSHESLTLYFGFSSRKIPHNHW